MKKKLIFLFLLSLSCKIFGFVDEYDYPVNSSGLYIGGRASRMAWKAPNEQFFGYLFGPCGGIDYRQPGNVYASYRFFIDFGNIIAGNCKRNFEDISMQGRLGFTVGKVLLLTPYVGLGVNIATHKRHDVWDSCKKLAFVDVEVPVGFIFSYHPNPRLGVGVDFQYLPQVDSWERITGFNAIRFLRGKKSQFCVEIPIQFSFPDPRWESVQYRFIPFYRTYEYGSSSVTSITGQTLSLPSQNAYEFGIRYEIAIW